MKCPICGTELIRTNSLNLRHAGNTNCVLWHTVEPYAVYESIHAAIAAAQQTAYERAAQYARWSPLLSGANADQLAKEIRALAGQAVEAGQRDAEPPYYCPDCQTQTSGRAPIPSGLHKCLKCDQYLFDSQLDDFPGQTKGA